jgi:hypothetical protein
MVKVFLSGRQWLHGKETGEVVSSDGYLQTLHSCGITWVQWFKIYRIQCQIEE